MIYVCRCEKKQGSPLLPVNVLLRVAIRLPVLPFLALRHMLRHATAIKDEDFYRSTSAMEKTLTP